MPLDDLRKLRDAINNFDFAAEQEQIVTDNKDVIADLQAEQWAQGLASDGGQIYPEYAPYTIEQKRGKPGLSGVTSHVTFYDTGETYRLLTAMINSGHYTITAATFKFDKIIKRSGKRVVGLTYDSREKFAKGVTLPGIKKVFKEKTGLEIN